MVLAQTEQNHQLGKRVDQRPTFKNLDEDDEDERLSGGLNHLVTRNAGGAHVKNVMPRNMFPEISTEETERSKNGKGFKGRGGEHIKNWRTAGHVCQNS